MNRQETSPPMTIVGTKALADLLFKPLILPKQTQRWQMFFFCVGRGKGIPFPNCTNFIQKYISNEKLMTFKIDHIKSKPKSNEDSFSYLCVKVFTNKCWQNDKKSVSWIWNLNSISDRAKNLLMSRINLKSRGTKAFPEDPFGTN